MGVNIHYKDSTIATIDATGTKILKTAGKYCEDDITVQYQAEIKPNYRKYEGTINSDVVGSSEKALLLTSEEIAQHYADTDFKCSVSFTPNPEAAYTVLQTTGYNVANREPYRATAQADSMQYTYREGATIGVYNTNTIPLQVKSLSSSGYVGRIICDASGHLYVMSGSANYGIRKGTFVVEVTW